MGVHKRKFNHQFYADAGKTLPRGVGDRYYAQDLARDHRYLQGVPGRVLLALLNQSGAVLLYGGAVTEGTTKARVNVAAAAAVVSYAFTVPDDGPEWLVPPATEAAEAPVLVEYPGALDLDLAALGATLDGVTVNYLKLKYREAPVQSRDRQYAAGSYDYSLEDSHVLACDAAAPTAADAVLAELTGDGASTLTITQRRPTGATPLAAPGSVVSRDAAGRAKVAAPVASDDIARKAEVDAITPQGNLSHGFVEYLGATNVNWVAPVGVTEVVLTGVGKGGDGAAGVAGTRGGGGGGSGAWCRNLRKAVVPGQSYSIVLSTSGDSTFFGVTLGKGGNASGVTGGAGGTGSGGASNGFAGGNGGPSAYQGGGGGGGIGGTGSTGTGAAARGGSSGRSSVGLNIDTIPGFGGSGPLNGASVYYSNNTAVDRTPGNGGPGAGGCGGPNSATAAGGTGASSYCGGGGGGGAGSAAAGGNGGAGGPPFLRIDW